MKHFVSAIFFISLLLSLSESNALLAKKKIDLNLYRKVGIMVNRMSNKQVYSPMPRITLKTDYSIRKPGQGTNVYIDDKKRLSESVPNYPMYTGSTTDHMLMYYRNFSPQITKGITTFFRQKGFEANDFRTLAQEMNIPFSEMSIKSILNACNGKIDALFILHYMDIGNFLVEKKEVQSKNIGFGSILYSIALFDVKKGKRLFYYSPIFPLTIENSLAHDVDIMNNPGLRSKIKIDFREEQGSTVTNVTHSFTDDELINHMIRIIINGLKCPKKPLSKSHKKIKCYPVKGLSSFF
jgi:hypothetical protein